MAYAYTDTFSYTGSYQVWTVPAGVLSVIATLHGASGGGEGYYGDSNPATLGVTGGQPGRLIVSIPVTPGETLRVYCGGRGTHGAVTGTAGGAGGYNGGADGAARSAPSGVAVSTPGGGGGGTDIRRYISGAWTRIAVAGGGGGGGGNGNVGSWPGGQLVGQGGKGSGGNGDTGADGVWYPDLGGAGGVGGSSSSAGAGGASPWGGGAGTGGSGPNGGAGGQNPGPGRGGGGGGGGYYGGGGGGEGLLGGAGGGGGGGSGHAAAGLTVLTADSLGFIWTHGSVALDYVVEEAGGKMRQALVF